MKMTLEEKKNYISEELYHELRCLLGAATVWSGFMEDKAGFNIVVAMDSAFVHARCLFEFFTGISSHDVRITDFGPKQQYQSAIYDDWKEPLNRHVMHISKGRLKGNETNIKDNMHLKDKVIEFAEDILRLWEKFEKDPSHQFTSTLIEARRDAIKDAEKDAEDKIPLFLFKE